jgi:hypothetical protein
MRAAYLVGMFSSMFFLAACGNNRSKVLETSGYGLTLKVMSVAPQEEDTAANIYSFKVLIVPSAAVENGLAKQQRDSLIFKMDSCFYVGFGHEKKYPLLVQAIPNGIKGTYEYLTDFEINGYSQGDSLVFNYQDKFINKKKYQVTAVK